MGVDLQECEECGEFDGRHRATECEVVKGCSFRSNEQIVAERAALVLQVRALDAELDKRKVKCPTCRCRILPGQTCRCCARTSCDDGEPLI